MESLFKRFRNTHGSVNNLSRMNPEEIADVLFCLCNAFEEGTLLQAAPENLSVREDGTVSVTPDSDKNIYYAAPEVVLGKSGADKNSGWFTMGLLTYFIINGRSYYEAKGLNIVNLQDLTGKGESFIRAQRAAENAENVPGLLDLAMRKFTSWKPEVRYEGVSSLLKAIRQYTSTAVIQYTYNGRTVSTESRRLDPPSVMIAAGYRVTDESGSAYQVKKDCKIPFRPGTHKYTVDVESRGAGRDAASGDRETGGADVRLEKYLCIQAASQRNMSKLMKLEQTPQLKKVEVDRSAAARYLFYVATGDPVHRKTLRVEYKFHVDIPAGTAGGKSLLYVTYDPPSGCKIALYNREGALQISDNVMHFEL